MDKGLYNRSVGISYLFGKIGKWDNSETTLGSVTKKRRVSDSASADDVNSDASGKEEWFEISNHQDQTEARGAPNTEMEQQEVGGEAPDGEQQEESLDDNQPPSQSSAITRRYPIQHRTAQVLFPFIEFDCTYFNLVLLIVVNPKFHMEECNNY